jgi:hypothetical protein
MTVGRQINFAAASAARAVDMNLRALQRSFDHRPTRLSSTSMSTSGIRISAARQMDACGDSPMPIRIAIAVSTHFER